MRLFDGPIALLPCVAYKYYERCEECRDEETCGIRSVFSDVRSETVRMLKKATLAEIIKRSKQLSKETPAQKKPLTKKTNKDNLCFSVFLLHRLYSSRRRNAAIHLYSISSQTNFSTSLLAVTAAPRCHSPLLNVLL
jgi:hypothetical protein